MRCEHADDAATVRKRDGAFAGRHEGDGIAANASASAPAEMSVIVAASCSSTTYSSGWPRAEAGAGLRLAVGDDEVLSARIPGAAVAVVLLGRGFVELGVFGAGEFSRRRRLGRFWQVG